MWTLRFPFRSKSDSRLIWEADGPFGVERRSVERMAPLIIGRPDQKGSTGRDNIMGAWWPIFEAMSGDPDVEYLISDYTTERKPRG